MGFQRKGGKTKNCKTLGGGGGGGGLGRVAGGQGFIFHNAKMKAKKKKKEKKTSLSHIQRKEVSNLPKSKIKRQNGS